MSDPLRMQGLTIGFDGEVLRPIIAQIVREVLAELEATLPKASGKKLAYSEPEAAALLSLAPQQLADQRRRGHISATVGPRRRWFYTHDDLLRYLASRRLGCNASRNKTQDKRR